VKKALYGTSALVAAGLLTGSASAASALKLGLSGFYRGAAGILAGGNSAQTGTTGGVGDFDRTGNGFRTELHINFTGQTTLNNGLTVGVTVNMNAGDLLSAGFTETPVRDSWVDFTGKFGNVRFGEFYSAAILECVLDPGNVTTNFGINSPLESFSDAAQGVVKTAAGNKIAAKVVGVTAMGFIGTCFGTETRGTKIAYFSPSVGGFTLALSYTPSGTIRNPGGGYFYGSDLRDAPSSNVLSVGFNFNHSFSSDYTMLVGGGGEWGLSSYTRGGFSNPDKPSTYMLGLQLGLPAGFKVGFSGEYNVNYKFGGYTATDAAPGDDGWVTTFGGSYAVNDKLSVGLQGLYSQFETNLFGPGHDTIWGVSLNSVYIVGGGLSLEGQIAYQKYDPNPNDALGAGLQPTKYSGVEIDGGFVLIF
jgi:outer membrane protein OmpU